MFQEFSFSFIYNKRCSPGYNVRDGILLTWPHDIISLREEVYVHQSSLTLPLFIDW
jgi:hypothetical protein